MANKLKPIIRPVLVVILLIVGTILFSIDYSRPQPSINTPTVKSTTVVVTKPTVKELQSLVNKERTKRNLGALALSTELTKSAQDKCKDMEKRNYWSHDTPDGEEPWVFIQRYVTSYISAGENLGRGYTDSESMVKAWMDSKSHRANILKPEYSHVGYAVCNGKINNLVVQHLTQL